MTPAQYYLASWTTGCAIGFGAGLFVLRRRGALDVWTAMALGWAWGGLIVGARWQSRMEVLPIAGALALTPDAALEPGMRIPLGLLVGAILGLGWCAIVRAPLRATGDALAVAASILIPIGRLGCIINGCCSGTVCPAWLGAICWRFPATSQAWAAQRRVGLVDVSAATSLPAHPLAVYFALASIATLAILLWQLHRNAAPGTLLLTFCVLRPLAKLTLEPLRADPPRDLLMQAIPASVLALALTTIVALGARRMIRAGRVPSDGHAGESP
ncbi:MAG TPA: prolipoprotein diacylglyceryl transferase family protein [Candidatus Binatia bacterium]|jgi:phosphatidylglycerol:prolipoprotein diacylglycerol transferase|nr:prolipoprotein diacylglyceryl transferase family protein [Candidatus Binatia bacterium]